MITQNNIIMNPIIKDLCDEWERKFPVIWRKCYPRVYRGVGEFESPRFVAVNLASAIQWVDLSKSTAPLPVIHLAIAASRMIDYKVPSFFIDKEFFLAISQTELPEDLKWTEAKLPFEAGILYLPPGMLKDPEGGNVSLLVWARIKKGEIILVGDNAKFECPEDEFTVVAICDSDCQRSYSRAVSASMTPYIKSGAVGQNRMGLFDLPITEDDEQFLQQIVSLCFSLLLSIGSKENLLAPEQRVQGKKTKKGNEGREFWTPNFIGKGYKIKREHQGGSHSSPKTHWRRGFFRSQRYGKGLVESKIIWIEPTLVGE